MKQHLVNLKKIFIILLILLSCSQVYAQRVYRAGHILNNQRVDQKRIHFGFTLGVNTMDYGIQNSAKDNYRAEQVTFSPSFSVGIVSDLKIQDNYALRFQPGLEFGERTISYANDADLSTPVLETTTESVVINLPLLFKYRSKRIDNYRPYLIGGVCYKMDVQAPSHLDVDDNVMISLKPNFFSLEFGFGIDFYLPYFKLATELKLSLGLRDILNHKLDPENPQADFYTHSINRMNSNVVTFSFHFE